MRNSLIEMNGDEMIRVLWKAIKDELMNTYVKLKN